MAELDPRIRGVLRAKYEGRVRYGVRTDYLRAYCLEHGLDPARADFVSRKPISRLVVHPTDRSSAANVLRRWVRGLVNAAALYLPVHGVPALLMARGRAARGGGGGGSSSSLFARLARVAQKVARSSVFLATYIANIFAWIYATRQCLRDDTTLGPFLGCATCGLSVLLESKPRRAELALYVFPRALHSWWIQLEQRGIVRSLRGGDVIVLAAALAVIVLHLEHEPESVKPSMQWLLHLVISKEAYAGTGAVADADADAVTDAARPADCC